MMSILQRWKQFSRHYFWSHFLFGVIAAAIGVPSAWLIVHEHSSTAAASANANLNTSALELVSREFSTSFDVSETESDILGRGWQQNPLQSYLSHLIGSWVPVNHYSLNYIAAAYINVQTQTVIAKQRMDDSDASFLAIILLNCVLIITAIYVLLGILLRSPLIQHFAVWFTTIGGIRAGPQFSSL